MKIRDAKLKGLIADSRKGTSNWQPATEGDEYSEKALVLFIIAVILITGVSVASAATTPVFDTDKLDSGIVAVSYDSGSTSRLKVMVEKNGQKLNYDLLNDGTIEYFPLQMGEGTYVVSVYENIQDKKYRCISSKTIQLDLANDKSVYLTSCRTSTGIMTCSYKDGCRAYKGNEKRQRK